MYSYFMFLLLCTSCIDVDVNNSDFVLYNLENGKISSRSNSYVLPLSINTSCEKSLYKFYVPFETEDGQICGSALIAPNYALTSGWCCLHFHGKKRPIAKWNMEARRATWATKVINEFVHPEYDTANEVNNICILQLDLPIFQSSNTQFIKLPSPKVNVCAKGNVVGITKRNNKPHFFCNAAKILLGTDCLETTQNNFSFCITQQKEMCENITGGFYVCRGELLGIKNRCSDDISDFTNVSIYRDFILSNLQNTGSERQGKKYIILGLILFVNICRCFVKFMK